jgi:hypothetical protein
MTKISKLMLGAGTLSVLGLTALPLTSYADMSSTALLQIEIQDDDSDGGGNNAYGYKWFISDKDGDTTNLTVDGVDGGDTGGFEMIDNSVSKTATGIATTGKYGFLAYYTLPTSDAATVTGGTLSTDGQNSATNATKYYGTALLTAAGATGASAVVEGSSPSAVETHAPGKLTVTVPELRTADGTPAGGANSWYKYNTVTMPAGTYQNTLTITTVARTS